MWADLGKVLGGAVGVTAIGAAFGLWNVDLAPSRAAQTPRADEAYLSQLSGGNQTPKKIAESATAKGGAGPLKVSGQLGRGNAIEQTVTPTTASNFYAFRDDPADRDPPLMAGTGVTSRDSAP